MPQTSFKPPKDKSWAVDVLKELGRDVKRPANKSNSRQETEVQKQLIIINQEANHSDSMKILADKGLRPLTYQEALVKIDQDPNLKEQLKGKWFWIAGEGTNLSGYYTFNEKGELKQGRGDIEKTVYVWKGLQSLSLGVRSDDGAASYGRRFALDADYGSGDVASVVVGVKNGHEVVASI